MFELDDFQKIESILQCSRTIAIVGLSPKKERPSNMVGRYLLEAGYTVIPVNPGQSEILGLPCYSTLSDIGKQVDMVDIFRRSEDVPPIVEEAVALGAKTIWMQQGIINKAAAELARQAGLDVIMDRCIKVDHSNLLN